MDAQSVKNTDTAEVKGYDAGKKVSGFDALPDVLKNEVAARYPEYRTPPALDDARPNETSWTYFKKIIDKKKAQAPQPPK